VAEVKLFRIEKMMGFAAPAAEEPASAPVETAEPEEKAPVVPPQAANDMTTGTGPEALAAVGIEMSLEELTVLRDRVAEATRLQSELTDLSAAIERTKQELSALHYDGPSAARFEEAGNELDAVVKATETATDTILTASERIDSAAAHLGASAADEMGRNQAEEIAEQVVNIFEACNFQDITGQRITKVVAALQYIDERVGKMMEIWGGPQDLAAFAPEVEEEEAHEEDESALLNGPALEEHHGHATQDDIDALFA